MIFSLWENKKTQKKTKEGRSQRSRRSCTKLSSTSGCGLSLTAAALSHCCSMREHNAFSSQVLCELSAFCPDLNREGEAASSSCVMTSSLLCHLVSNYISERPEMTNQAQMPDDIESAVLRANERPSRGRAERRTLRAGPIDTSSRKSNQDALHRD